MNITYTEENYIKAIYALSSEQGGVASTTDLSERLSNKAGSVTEMLKRLSIKKLIHYMPYQGVSLTASGRRVAIEVVRRHRLWEVFLVQSLGFKWDEVHDLAEQLEHVQSKSLTDRLDSFLGFPRFDPHGDPIPDARGKLNEKRTQPLTAGVAGGCYVFMGVADHSTAFLKHLTSLGLSIGGVIDVIAVNDYDRSMLVKIDHQNHFLSDKVSMCILVEQHL